MKRILLLSSACLLISASLSSQIDAGEDVTICTPGSVSLSATVTGTMGTTSYSVSSIPWASDVLGGTTVTLSDDAVSGALPIGFSFCFLGNSYTQFFVGSNGWIGFTVGQPTAFTSQTIPNTAINTPKNCIMGPWQDWNPGVGGTIKYQTLGTAPNRRLVVTFDNVPMYLCTANLGKFQFVLYESTNIIQNHLFNKPNCTGWAGGSATQGIHNLAGTTAYVVPGRNSTQWTATNESWQYTPSGVTWTLNGINVGSQPNITVNANTTSNYVATVSLCAGGTFTDTVTVYVGAAVSLANSEVVGTSCNTPSGSISIDLQSPSPGPFVYEWTGIGSTASELTGLDEGDYTVTVTDESNGCEHDETFTIEEANTIELDMDHSNLSCTGADDGTATINATSDFPNFSYQWNDDDAQTTAMASNLEPGAYQVIVTDGDGCDENAFVIITEPTPLVVNFSQVEGASCYGNADGEVTATASGGVGPYTYDWGNSNEQTLTDLTAGEYTVTVSDNNGCETESAVTVAQPQSLLVEFNISNSSCQGITDGTITASAQGGTGNYDYFWVQPGSTGPTITNLDAGTYTVEVTDDNGCVLTVDALLEPTLSLDIQSEIVQVSCYGLNNGSVTVSTSGGTPGYTYQWNDPLQQQSETASGLAAGAYEVTVTDDNGCIGIVDVEVTQPAALAYEITQQVQPGCNGSDDGALAVEVNGGTMPYVYDWSNNGDTPGINNLNAGNYYLEITDANDCVIELSISLDEPSELEVSLSGAGPLCNGGNNGYATAATAGGTQPYTYEWSANSESSSTNTSLTSGNQTVTVTDANGCEVSDNIILNQPSALTLSTDAEIATCSFNDGSVSADASGGVGPYFYSWPGTGQTGSEVNNLGAGVYQVVVTDNNGCTESTEVTVPETSVNASFTSDVSEGLAPLDVTFYNNTTGADEFSWDFGNGEFTATDNVNETVSTVYENDGSYTVTLTASIGECSDEDTLTIFIFLESALVLVPNVVTADGQHGNDTFRVISRHMESMDLKIFNRWGNEIATLQNPDAVWTPSDNPGGTYFYVLHCKGYDGKEYDAQGSFTVLKKEN